MSNQIITSPQRLQTTQYDLIFSMGEACFCADMLRKFGLRIFSAPFDWMAGSNLSERFQLFLNDFNRFIEKQDFVYIDKRYNPLPRDIYKNNHTGITFNHDFPMNGNFDETFYDVQKKYHHRINRLLKTIQQEKNVLIVYIEQPFSQMQQPDIDEMTILLEKANAKYPDTNIDLLYIKHNIEMKSGEYKIYHPHPNVFFAECNNRNQKPHEITDGNHKNVGKILRQFKVKKTFKYYKKAFILYAKSLPSKIFSIRNKIGETHLTLLGAHINLTKRKNKILKKLGIKEKHS